MSATLELICHPRCIAPPQLAIRAEVAALPDGGLQIAYEIAGASALLIPPRAPPAATDGLWQHTCCEAFVATADLADYREFNFSPSGCWAAYRFAAYRDRDRDRDAGWLPPAAPGIACLPSSGKDCLRLVATVPANLLPDARRLELSLTAVAADRHGQKSYWALAHTAAQPDFHCRDSFTLTLDRS